jgi:hypothetical protein
MLSSLLIWTHSIYHSLTYQASLHTHSMLSHLPSFPSLSQHLTSTSTSHSQPTSSTNTLFLIFSSLLTCSSLNPFPTSTYSLTPLPTYTTTSLQTSSYASLHITTYLYFPSHFSLSSSLHPTSLSLSLPITLYATLINPHTSCPHPSPLTSYNASLITTYPTLSLLDAFSLGLWEVLTSTLRSEAMCWIFILLSTRRLRLFQSTPHYCMVI